MGSVPLLGVLCAWGGTLQYFLESFFLVFSSAPGFPRWSFYAARGEHLWSFLGNVIPQLLQRNLKQMLFFTIKLKILVYFGGMGPVGGRVWNQGGQNIEKGNRCQPHLEVILEAFFVVLADVFLVHFQGRCCSSRWARWEPKGSPKGRFWEDILKLSGGHGQHVKIDVFSRRQPNSEGSGGSRNQ